MLYEMQVHSVRFTLLGLVFVGFNVMMWGSVGLRVLRMLHSVRSVLCLRPLDQYGFDCPIAYGSAAHMLAVCPTLYKL